MGFEAVIAGLVPAISIPLALRAEASSQDDRDDRDKPGHDAERKN
jgi:hypothetical protein